MAYTFAIDPRTNDAVVNKFGTLQMISGQQEVKQRILIALQHLYQEYFLNTPAGVPWDELILGSKDEKLTKSILIRTVREVPGVVGVLSLTLSRRPANRREIDVYITAEVSGAFGTDIITIIDKILVGG